MRQRAGKLAFASLALVVGLLNHAKALENGCGRLPPMGYNTWNDFGCKNLTSASIGLVADRCVKVTFSQEHLLHLIAFGGMAYLDQAS
jgi:hypothetical protein